MPVARVLTYTCCLLTCTCFHEQNSALQNVQVSGTRSHQTCKPRYRPRIPAAAVLAMKIFRTNSAKARTDHGRQSGRKQGPECLYQPCHSPENAYTTPVFRWYTFTTHLYVSGALSCQTCKSVGPRDNHSGAEFVRQWYTFRKYSGGKSTHDF